MPYLELENDGSRLCRRRGSRSGPGGADAAARCPQLHKIPALFRTSTMNEEDICRICFLGSSAGQLIQPCHCRGSIGYTHKACMEKWVSERREEECNICHFRYHIIKERKTFLDLMRDRDGRIEPLVFASMGVLELLSLIHQFAFSMALTAQLWHSIPTPLKAQIPLIFAMEIVYWSIFPIMAFRLAWDSCNRWRQLNADVRIVLSDASPREPFAPSAGSSRADPRPGGAPPADAPPVDSSPADPRAGGASPADAPPVDSSPADSRAGGAPPADAPPVDSSPVDPRPEDAGPAGAPPVYAPPAHPRPTDAPPAEAPT
ncbi:E3 ubiquitin-protein ligase MARCHF3-like [Ornithodoros turicata]|uniref:E3 ubiquitin-protein ligase MARCHF3-like n=1 Tax=Ornithodoros turicata TaxID=34597 RepID=UPI0031395F46